MRGDPGISCRGCGHANPQGSRFCGDCGEALVLEISCDDCGAQPPPDARFCLQCGAAVDRGAAQESAPDWRIDAGEAFKEGERKQITVLFADVHGSMDLAERLDPESWRELMQRFFGVLTDAVHRADGTVDKFTGDGIMALFGAPIAREDHALCACRAALDMIRSVDELAADLRGEGIDLAVRVGINSGEVVVGSIGEGRMEYTAVGHTVGLAQRMEAEAEVGAAYLTATTAALAEGFFELTDLGERPIKGASAPIHLHRLDGVGSAHGHLDVSRTRGLTRFVGRAAELSELEAAYERALSGAGEVVGVVAPAGVGKSRLCHEFVNHCRKRGIAAYHAQCEAHTQEIPLVPVLQLLRSRFGITAVDTDTTAQEKIRSELALIGLGAASEEDVALLLEFLGLPDPDALPITMNGDARNRRLRDLVRRLVHAPNRIPAVILVEDLHWIDEASALFLETLVEAVPASGGLVVANFRPEYRASWMGRSHYRQLPLSPLSTESLTTLLHELLGDDASLDGLVELVTERTEGNPFYAEEVVRELAEAGTLEGPRGAYRMAREIEELPVPPTVQAILAARIDRLPPDAKVTLQAAAVIGSEASRELLCEVIALDEEEIASAIGTLVTNEFIHETSLYPEQIYRFRHRLTQEVAYGSQLAPARARAHLAVAVGLQATDPDRVEENAGIIGKHYEQAGDTLQAAQWYLRAIEWSGFRDPMASIRFALQVVDLDASLPDGPEGDNARLTARLFVASMGWRVGADPAIIRKAFDEGVRLAERVGHDVFNVLLHAAFAACPLTCEGRTAEGIFLAMEGVRLADATGDPDLRAMARVFPCYTLWLQGRLHEMVAMCDEILELTANRPTSSLQGLLASPRIWALTIRSPALLALGHPDEARASIDAALEQAADTDQELLAWAHMFAASHHLMGGEMPIDELVRHVRASVELADRLGDAFSRSWSNFWDSYAALESGQAQAAVDGFTRALAEIHERGSGLESESFARRGLGLALIEVGRVDEGIASARLAVSRAEENDFELFELFARETVARALIDRDAPGDRAEARTHLGVSASLADRFCILLYIARVADLQASMASGSVTGT